jgi:hypothetical protein
VANTAPNINPKTTTIKIVINTATIAIPFAVFIDEPFSADNEFVFLIEITFLIINAKKNILIVYQPKPPINICKNSINWPPKLNCSCIETTVRPVSENADDDINIASINSNAGAPVAWVIGDQSNNAPTIEKTAYHKNILIGIVKLLNKIL